MTHLISNLPFQRLRIDNLVDLLHKCREIEEVMSDLHLIRLNPGHIQNVVDQERRYLDEVSIFLKTVFYCPRIVQLDLADGTHADDGVHRCPDIVAHAGGKSDLARLAAWADARASGAAAPDGPVPAAVHRGT